MDSVSRQAAIDALGERPISWTDSEYELGKQNQYDEDMLALIDVPTVEVEPVRHGRWLEGNRGKHDGTLYWYRYCSECLYERHDDNEDKDTPYCPDCGARMDEGKYDE